MYIILQKEQTLSILNKGYRSFYILNNNTRARKILITKPSIKCALSLANKHNNPQKITFPRNVERDKGNKMSFLREVEKDSQNIYLSGALIYKNAKI